MNDLNHYFYLMDDITLYMLEKPQILTFQYDYLASPSVYGGLVVSRTRFIYDEWNLIAELKYNHLTQVEEVNYYLWGLDVSHTLHGAGGVGGLLAAFTPSGMYVPSYDAAGNIYQYLDMAGGVYCWVLYGPFGEPLSGSFGLLPFWYSTKYWDAESYLFYFGNRYYSFDLGRFISRDPLEESGGLNLYAYCENDPMNKWDYLGQTSIFDPSIIKIFGKKCENKCGKADVTSALSAVLSLIEAEYNILPKNNKERNEKALKNPIYNLYPTKEQRCKSVYSFNPITLLNAWDINELADIGKGKEWPFKKINQGTGECERTVTLNGKCYYASAVNYSMWGKITQLCERTFPETYSIEKALIAAGIYKQALWGWTGNLQLNAALQFTVYGYGGHINGLTCDLNQCSTKEAKSSGSLTHTWLPKTKW